MKARRRGLICGAYLGLAIACADQENYVSDPILTGTGGAGGRGGGSAGGSAGNIASGGMTAGKGGSSGSSGGAAAGSSGSAGTSSSEAGSGGSDDSGGTGNAGNAGSAGSGGTSGGSTGGGGGSGGSAACTSSSPHTSCTCQVYDGHDYWFCTTKAEFDVAEGNCVAANMHLTKVSSSAEDAWLYSTGFATLGEYWLGSSDESTPDTWTWLWGGTFWTGTANGTANGYEHWNDSEPNASGECGVVQTGGVWDDRICTDQRGYVCESAGD